MPTTAADETAIAPIDWQQNDLYRFFAFVFAPPSRQCFDLLSQPALPEALQNLWQRLACEGEFPGFEWFTSYEEYESAYIALFDVGIPEPPSASLRVGPRQNPSCPRDRVGEHLLLRRAWSPVGPKPSGARLFDHAVGVSCGLALHVGECIRRRNCGFTRPRRNRVPGAPPPKLDTHREGQTGADRCTRLPGFDDTAGPVRDPARARLSHLVTSMSRSCSSRELRTSQESRT